MRIARGASQVLLRWYGDGGVFSVAESAGLYGGSLRRGYLEQEDGAGLRRHCFSTLKIWRWK